MQFGNSLDDLVALLPNRPEIGEVGQCFKEQRTAGSERADDDQRLHQVGRLEVAYLAARRLLTLFDQQLMKS